MFHVLRLRAGAGQLALPSDASRLAALHGEDSTRTRHVLAALRTSEPPVAAVRLLGRVRRSPDEIRALWKPRVGTSPLPALVLPLSPRACLEALRDAPTLLIEELALAARSRVRIPIREEVAIVFRVLPGAAAARWWRRSGIRAEVVFGQTGTADTTLFERAIQAQGGRTVHAVHGQATGPNFVVVFDVALFRSEHDARGYARLGGCGRWATQAAPRPARARRAVFCC